MKDCKECLYNNIELEDKLEKAEARIEELEKFIDGFCRENLSYNAPDLIDKILEQK